ncbi:MAG: glycosyltransferase family 87 protein [Candidatus Aminicenantaceae bacterium]
MRTRTSLLILLCFAIFLLLFLFKVKESMVDFEVNYKAGKRLRMAETLYRVEDGHYMFKYLPSAAMLYIPLSFFPLDVAKGVWYFIVIICSVSLVFISGKILTLKRDISSYVIILPPLILARYFFREIQLGQINAVVTMGLFFMTWCMAKQENSQSSRREICAGIFWGLGVALKPYALIFFPYFVVKKKWKALLSGVVFIVLAVVSPAFFYGIRGNAIVHKEWASTLSQSTPSLLNSQDNISIMALFMKWTGNQDVSLFLAGAIIAFLAFFVLFIIVRGKEMTQASVLECSVLLICIPLVSPLGWDYTLLMSVLGLMIIVHNFFRFSKFWRGVCVVNFFVITFSLYDIMGRELLARFMSWNVITINFLIVISFLSYLRFRKVC